MQYENIELHNVCGIVRDDGKPGFGMSRLPLDILPSINKGAADKAMDGSGCEIRGVLPEGGEARIVLQTLNSNTTVPTLTVYHGCFCGQALRVGKDPVEIIVKTPDRIGMMSRIARDQKHPFDPRLVRVRLPPIHTVRILSIDGDLAYPDSGTTPSRTLLSYGSSITHGACANTPEGTYAAQCAMQLGYDLINLGFGGAAHMDRPIAAHIAGRKDWDVATLEMGINVRTWPLEKFHEAVETFVTTLVQAQPDKPIYCIDLFTYFDDFEPSPELAVGFRDAVESIVNATGSDKVRHVDGRTLLTRASGLRTDLVHPSDDGMQEMGCNLADVIRNTR
jgi:hypothetical protein